MDFVDYILEKKMVGKFTREDIIRAANDIGINLSKYDYKNVILGMRVETKHGSKHGNDVNVTGDQPQPTLKLVIGNLRENPKYYTDIINKKKKTIRESLDSAVYFSTYVNYINTQRDKIEIGAGVLPICKNTGRILMAKRAGNISQPNVWAGFGGKLEEKYGESEEDVMEIAKREFCEETAFKDYYSIVPTYVYATPNGTFKFYNFIGLFENEFEPMLNSEHTESKWFSLKDIEDIKSDDIHFGIKLLFMNDPSIIKKYAK